MSKDKTDEKIHDWINENIISKCQDGDYIFRGESKKYKAPEGVPLSSGLYRQFCIKTKDNPTPIRSRHFSVVDVEKDRVEKAGRHVTGKNIDVLTELQHYGGETALIDFTYNVYIALFFACDGNFGVKGVLYLYPKNKTKEKEEIEYDAEEYTADILIEPTGKNPRVIFQSSVFIHARRGRLYVSGGIGIDIPSAKKQDILSYLKKNLAISAETIYNDIHGFIKNQHNYSTADIEFYSGVAKHDEGDYDGAIKHYDKAIELNPESSEAYCNRGHAKHEKGDYDDAIEDYDKAIKLNPEGAFAYNNRGLAKYNKGDYDDAIKDYDKAIELNPEDAFAYNNRGVAKYEEDDYDDAIEDYDKAIELNSEYAFAYNNRGIAKYHKGNYDDAIKDYDKAIELNPEYAEAYNNRGNAKGHKGDYDDAIKDYDKAIEINSEFADAYYNRAEAIAQRPKRN